eukprot:226581-Chlamydomonas_euryale.AAC.2
MEGWMDAMRLQLLPARHEIHQMHGACTCWDRTGAIVAEVGVVILRARPEQGQHVDIMRGNAR